MKTSVLEVHDMLEVFSVDEVEKRIGEVPGVLSVTVNFAAAKATVRYDETRLEIADVKSAVRQRGYEAPAPASSAPEEGHAGHLAPTAAPESHKPAAPTSASGSPTTKVDPAVSAAPDKAAPSTTAHAPPAAPSAAPPGDSQPDKAAAEKS